MSFKVARSLIANNQVRKFTRNGVVDLSAREQAKVQEIERDGQKHGKRVLFLAEYNDIQGNVRGIDYIYELENDRYLFNEEVQGVWAVYEAISRGMDDEGNISIRENNGIVQRVQF